MQCFVQFVHPSVTTRNHKFPFQISRISFGSNFKEQGSFVEITAFDMENSQPRDGIEISRQEAVCLRKVVERLGLVVVRRVERSQLAVDRRVSWNCTGYQVEVFQSVFVIA